MRTSAQATFTITDFSAEYAPFFAKRRAQSAGRRAQGVWPASRRCRPVFLHILLLLCGLTGMLPGQSAAQEQAVYFADHPVLTPDGDTVIFAYEGDLWKAAADGGLAVRLTAMEGIESRPSVSPDGRWLAFTGRQYGNGDVYLMPLAGGAIRQLTFHEADDEVESWSWDNRRIFFRSDRYNRLAAYAVDRDGGTPSRLFEHYFNTVHNVAEHPQNGALFFNESWESSLYVHRKGYRGDYNPDLKSYDPKTGAYREYTDFEGKDFGATIDRQGRIFFLSDEYNGEYNLYELVDGEPKRLTGYESSAWSPRVSADGERIVFQQDYQLRIYEVTTGRTLRPDIRILRNNTLDKTQDFNVKGEITAFDVAPDGKKLAFVSRGELFVSDSKGKFIRQLPTRADGRVLEVHWLKDNRTLLFNQTVEGYQNWFTLAADGSGAERQLTNDRQNNRQLSFNSDRSQAVYLSGRRELRLLDLESLDSKVLTEEELWGFYNDTPLFAPDDRHIVFTAYRDFERDILLYDLQSGTTRNLTQTGVTEAAPHWSPDGKYLYLVSNPTRPSYPFGLDDPNLYRLALQPYDEPYRSEKFAELFEEEKEANEDEEKEADGEKSKAVEKPEIRIDEERLMERLESVGPTFGSQQIVHVSQKDEVTTLLFNSNHEGGKYRLYKTVLQPFESTETKAVEGADNADAVRCAEDDWYALIDGDLYTIDLNGNKVQKIALDLTFRRRLQPEFEQMFRETWANMEENFYDEDFHGVDWAALRDRYAAYLPHVNTRNDLRRLLNDLLGELNTSHFGFRSQGDEEDTYYGSRTLATGLVFSEEDPYRIERIVARSPAALQGVDIRPGDVLLAVDGEAVDPRRNREAYFARPSLDEELELRLQRGGAPVTARVHPAPYRDIRELLYDEWEDERQRRVDEQGDRRIAYVHMKNMGGGELDRFLRDMVAEGNRRDALILDLRYNTGGNVHDRVLQFLSQRPYLQWKYRGGALASQPNFTPAAKPIALLINEQSLSDAEMTTAGFQELGLGTVIGTETYRWIIFTTGKGLVDGSFYRLPAWGCYTLDGRNLEKTGVAPDIYVRNTFADRLQDADPQLDRAIRLLLERLDSDGTR